MALKKLQRNDPCWCGSGKKYKSCHEQFDTRLHMMSMNGHLVPPRKLNRLQKSRKAPKSMWQYWTTSKRTFMKV